MFSIKARLIRGYLQTTRLPIYILKTQWKSLHANLKFSSDTGKMSLGKVLVTRPDIPAIGLDMLRQQCDTIVWEEARAMPRAELIKKISGVNGVYCVLSDKIDDEVLNAAGPQLKVVATMSVGVDHLNLEALKNRQIKVGYTPGVLTNATTELTIGLLLATSRRLIEANKALFRGEWRDWGPTFMCGPGLLGKTVGIVGLGRIGCKVANCLNNFGVASILYTSRTAKQEASEFNGKKIEFNELLAKSDFVIVTIASTPETRGMFNKQAFENMKNSAIFINVSRGDIVDQPALIEALKNGQIRAAGLDVMTPEPIPLDNELLTLNNCVLLPHIGSAAIETREEMAKITANNILSVLKGKPEEMPSPFSL